MNTKSSKKLLISGLIEKNVRSFRILLNIAVRKTEKVFDGTFFDFLKKCRHFFVFNHKTYIYNIVVEKQPKRMRFDQRNVMATVRRRAAMHNHSNEII